MTDNQSKQKLKNYMKQYRQSVPSRIEPHKNYSLTQTAVVSSGHQGYEHFNLPTTNMGITTSGHQGYDLQPQILTRMVISTSGQQIYEPFNNLNTDPLRLMSVATSGHQGYELMTITQPIPVTYMAVPTSGQQGGHIGYIGQNNDTDIPGYNPLMGGASLDICFRSLIKEKLESYPFPDRYNNYN